MCFLKLNILILYLISVNCMTSNEFCYIKEKDCIGVYDSNNNYQIKCHEVNCHPKYSFKCGTISMCSSRKTSCEKYLNITESFTSLFKSLKYKVEKEKFAQFTKNIKPCPMLPYRWSEADVCLNGQGCLMKKEYLMRSGEVKYNKKIECPCANAHSFRCGRGYCAKNKKTCDEFLLMAQKNAYEIKSCGNSFTLLGQTFKLF